MRYRTKRAVATAVEYACVGAGAIIIATRLWDYSLLLMVLPIAGISLLASAAADELHIMGYEAGEYDDLYDR